MPTTNQDLYDDMLDFFGDLIQDSFDLGALFIGVSFAILGAWLLIRASIAGVRKL